jgi:hypothetical protein
MKLVEPEGEPADEIVPKYDSKTQVTNYWSCPVQAIGPRNVLVTQLGGPGLSSVSQMFWMGSEMVSMAYTQHIP